MLYIHIVNNLISNVIKNELKELKKNTLDDVMSREKINKWKIKFTFWDTPKGKVRLRYSLRIQMFYYILLTKLM